MNIPRDMARQLAVRRALMGEMERTMDPGTYITRVHIVLSDRKLEILRLDLTQAKRTRKKLINFMLNGTTSWIPRKMAVGIISSHIRLRGGVGVEKVISRRRHDDTRRDTCGYRCNQARGA